LLFSLSVWLRKGLLISLIKVPTEYSYLSEVLSKKKRTTTGSTNKVKVIWTSLERGDKFRSLTLSMMSYLMWYLSHGVLPPERLVFWVGFSVCAQVVVELHAENFSFIWYTFLLYIMECVMQLFYKKSMTLVQIGSWESP